MLMWVLRRLRITCLKNRFRLILTGIYGSDRFLRPFITIISLILPFLWIRSKMNSSGGAGGGTRRWAVALLPTGAHICLILHSGDLEWTGADLWKYLLSATELNSLCGSMQTVL